jgi:magnesium chelatase family protein
MYVTAYTPFGVDGIIVRVEADIRRGIPGMDITGLAKGAVQEARERVRAAFRNSGYPFPKERVLINLAPAGVRKEGASLDLPIAVAVMAAAGLIPPPDNLMILGELELSGSVRPVRGALAATAAGIKADVGAFIVPLENAAEARILAADRVAAAATLRDAADAVALYVKTGSVPAITESRSAPPAPEIAENGDFAEVCGQGRYKRALEIAAAGAHNLLVFGPPGAGKTMLARRLPSIMPPLLPEEAVEVTRLHSLAGQLPSDAALIGLPPFRSPHHSASAEGILGGGKTVRPGEISLAHFGVLFMDEAPEFRAHVLQALREPLEDRMISISRAEGPVHVPADFQLILAANPCPCGKLGIKTGEGSCFCTPEEIHRYWRKFGAALLDRVELRVALHAPDVSLMRSEERSEAIRERVQGAVRIQRQRFKAGATSVRRNARMTPAQIERYCVMTSEAEAAFRQAAAKLDFSGRAFHAILRVARTIADLAGAESIATAHVLEAVQHRRLGDDPSDLLD